MIKNRNILITGGAGFIGSHVVEYFAKNYPHYRLIIMDCLTYAADKKFWSELLYGAYENVETFVGDIRKYRDCDFAMKSYAIDSIIHLAAESHVDNSINNPTDFVETNVNGTVNLLNAAKNFWGESNDINLFYHISTDEVFGALGKDDIPFDETTPYDPRSPYSASKAASDHFVRAYGNTFKLPYVISNCSNNYGPRQHSEKLIPKTINNLLTGKKIPIYGRGENIRDWLYVGDHVRAIDKIFHEGKIGETYCIGGGYEVNNLDLVKKIIDIYLHSEYDGIYPRGVVYKDFIEYVTDRKGHDFRYSIDSMYITEELGWLPKMNIMDGMQITYKYYKDKFK